MKHILAGFIICMLLVVNVSAATSAVIEKKYIQKDGDATIIDIHRGFAPSCGHRSGPNLAPNPSFEDGTTMPTGWTYDHNDTGIYTWDTTEAHSGNKSIGVRNLSSAVHTPELTWVTTDYIPVDADNSTYSFTAWYNFLKLPAATQSASIFIDVYDTNHSYLGGSGVGEWYAGSGWRLLGLTASLSPHGAYVKLELGQEVIWPNEPDPSVEIRFDDVNFSVANTVPTMPVITGETHGKARTVYSYTITATDPDQDHLKYFIDWGDNTTQMTSQYASGERINLTHIWGYQGTYTIKVKAIDKYGMESRWATLTINLPCTNNEPLHTFWVRLFERFPHAFPLLRHRLGYY